MPSLIEMLADHRSLVTRVKVAAPAPFSLRRVVALMQSEPDTSEQAEETAALQGRIATAVRLNNVTKLSKRDLRAICNVFLHSPEPPGRDAAIGDKIVAEIERRKLRSPVLALFNAYLDGFRPDDADVIRLGSQLNSLTENILRHDANNWASRARRLALFDPREAPSRLAANVLASSKTPTSVLAEAGLNSEVRTRGRLAEASFRLGCLAAARVAGPSGMPLQTPPHSMGAR